MDTIWSQLGLGATVVGLGGVVFRQFVSYVSKRVAEDRVQHAEELERLEKSWEARLADQREVRQSWEDTAKTLQKTNAQQADQLDALLPAVATMVKTLEAIREEQTRR